MSVTTSSSLPQLWQPLICFLSLSNCISAHLMQKESWNNVCLCVCVSCQVSFLQLNVFKVKSCRWMHWNFVSVNGITILHFTDTAHFIEPFFRWMNVGLSLSIMNNDVLIFMSMLSFKFSSVQLLSCIQLLATSWITACQASLSITNTWSSLRLTSIESVMPSSHFIFCCPLLLLLPIPPRFRVFSKESTLLMRWPKYWSFSFSIIPSKEIPGPISFRMDRLDLLAVQETLQSLL